VLDDEQTHYRRRSIRGIMTQQVDHFEERASMIHVVAVVASSMLLAAGAQAQTPCDQLKAVLAARIDAAGARGYSLEAVPAGTPVPPSAKFIGTCEGGASAADVRHAGSGAASLDCAGHRRAAAANSTAARR
jgi:Protein of unknown function (DUF1161)